MQVNWSLPGPEHTTSPFRMSAGQMSMGWPGSIRSVRTAAWAVAARRGRRKRKDGNCIVVCFLGVMWLVEEYSIPMELEVDWCL